jgi:hypothetical protein
MKEKDFEAVVGFIDEAVEIALQIKAKTGIKPSLLCRFLVYFHLSTLNGFILFYLFFFKAT